MLGISARYSDMKAVASAVAVSLLQEFLMIRTLAPLSATGSGL